VPVLLALATGARRGEILALRWQDLNLDAGTVTIRRSLSETRNGLAFKGTKSDKPRLITLPAFAVAPLKQYRHDQHERRLLLGKSYQNNDLVVCTWDGRPWAPNLVTGAFGDLTKKLELEGVHFHTLRHTHISQLLMQGVPLKVASARAGHATVGITADIYGHLLPGADEQAAQQLDTFLAIAPTAAKG
jgi:integrase